jgi:hypothetical protein
MDTCFVLAFDYFSIIYTNASLSAQAYPFIVMARRKKACSAERG